MNTNIELQGIAQIAVRTGNWLLVVGPRAIDPTLLVLTARLAEEGASAAHAAETADGGWSPTLRFGDASQKPPRPAVRVVDGGNRFNAYTVARAARGRSEILKRITVSRAFTCYQVLTMLEHASATLVAEAADGGLVPPRLARAIPVSYIVLDLLSTFYDESVQAGERKRLLRACITHLERLAGALTPQLVADGSSKTRPTGLPWGEDVHFVDVMLRNVVETADIGWNPPRLVVSVHPPAIPSQTAVELLGQLQASAVDTYFIQPAAPAPEPMRLF